MEVTALQTRILKPPKDDLLEVIDTFLPTLDERGIIAVSSKAVAIWQGRCVPIPSDRGKRRTLKESLVKREAECYLSKNEVFTHSRLFTVYEGVFGSMAGIDESNGDGFFILPPKNVQDAAKRIMEHLKERFSLQHLGVLIVDSRTHIMRNGVTGVALGHAGFRALYDYRGKGDVFGRTLRSERLHVADCIAAAATLVMGEGNECAPLALFNDVPHVEFDIKTEDDPYLQPGISMDDDVFAQFLCNHPWERSAKKHRNET